MEPEEEENEDGGDLLKQVEECEETGDGEQSEPLPSPGILPSSSFAGSISNLSDGSSATAIAGTTPTPAQSNNGGGPSSQAGSSRPRMDIACVIDTSSGQRGVAFEELKCACAQVGANLELLEFEKLDFGELNTVDSFYSADVAVVDLSVQVQQSTLCYHLGVRESFEMKENIVIYEDEESEATLRMKISCGNYTFVPWA